MKKAKAKGKNQGCAWRRGFLVSAAVVNRQSPNRQCCGGVLFEAVLIVPVLVLLFVGAMEMGKIALTYYQLQKSLHGAAGMVSVLRGANFCDPEDPQLAAIKSFIVFGPEGNTNNPVVRGLTTDNILITPERADTDNTAVTECECGGPGGCLLSDNGRQPDYVRLSIDGGYPFQPHIPFRTLDRILLRPHVRVPFGGQ